MRRLALALVAAGTFWPAACHDPEPIAVEDYPAEYARSVCESMARCGRYPDTETCLHNRSWFRRPSEVLASFEAGRLEYAPERARECVDRMFWENAGCTIFGSPPEIRTRRRAICRSVFTGDVQVGGTCYINEECQADARCRRGDCPDACCPGVCVRRPTVRRAALGEDCTHKSCPHGAYCNSENVCEERDRVGEPCERLGTCVEGARCANYLPPDPGVCVEPPDRGEPCESNTFFPEYACLRETDWCDPADEICKPRIQIGDACDSESECVRWGYCDESGTCAARPLLGDSCRRGESPYCIGHFVVCNLEGVCTGPNLGPLCRPPAD